MTEEKARHYAKALAEGIGIIFYVVRSRERGFVPVQIPSDDCEILATDQPTQQRERPALPAERSRSSSSDLARQQQEAACERGRSPPQGRGPRVRDGPQSTSCATLMVSSCRRMWYRMAVKSLS